MTSTLTGSSKKTKPTQRAGELTSTQYEIMQVIWPKGRCGASAGEIWKAISKERTVSRTTILNLVDRLEKRGWLKKQPARETQCGSANRFVATIGRRKATKELANRFVDQYFDGNISSLVMALVGARRPSIENNKRLNSLFDQTKEQRLSRGQLESALRLLLD